MWFQGVLMGQDFFLICFPNSVSYSEIINRHENLKKYPCALDTKQSNKETNDKQFLGSNPFMYHKGIVGTF